MAKEPAQRYGTMAELVMALQELQMQLPVEGDAPTAAGSLSGALAAVAQPRATAAQPRATAAQPRATAAQPLPGVGATSPPPTSPPAISAPAISAPAISAPAISAPAISSSRPVAVGAPSQLGLPDVAATQQKSRAPLFAGAGVLLLLLIGGAAWLSRGKPPPPAPPVVDKPAPPVVDKPAPPPGVQLLEVVVGTVPPGAKLLRDGKLVAETPDAIKLPAGETWSVVLHKDGYADQPITLDPAHDKKMLVKLEKLASSKSGRSGKLREPYPVAKSVVPPAPAAPPPPSTPVFVPASHPAAPADPVAAAVERLARSSAPGARRVGGFYAGSAGDEGQHSDWWVTLEGGRCYDFVTTGGPGVERVYVYLWGPNGKRATDRKEGSPGVSMHYCATQAGSYHFQAKMAGGKGEYRMGLYVK